MSAFIKSVQNTAHAHDLWAKGSKILVGVSGGPGSACLLDVLVFLGKKYDWQLHIAHVNYGLRGEDSDADEAFVRGLAEHYDIPCSVFKAKSARSNNLEEHLRDIRYRFFEETRLAHGFDLIAVAHTLDDQAETLLMRLIRGSGLSGLRAMRPKAGMIIRPLLDTSRKDVLAYLEEKKLSYRIDSSNTDERFFRNKIRHQLLPYLQKEFNPAIKDTLASTAKIISEDYDTLASLTKECSIDFKHTNNEITFRSDELLALQPSIRKSSLRHFFSLIKGNLKGITSAHTEEVIKMLRSDKSKHKTVSFAGLSVSRKGDFVTLSAV